MPTLKANNIATTKNSNDNAKCLILLGSRGQKLGKTGFGVELGGQRAADGFEALADLDSNGDGQFNAADADFASVKLWKDANQNGISEAGELFTFAQLGVQGIKVAGKRDGTALTDALGAPTGNTQILVGSFTWATGGSGQAGTTALASDLTFTTNAFYRRFSDDPTPTAAALALPNMQGSGLVRDLRAAGEALRER